MLKVEIFLKYGSEITVIVYSIILISDLGTGESSTTFARVQVSLHGVHPIMTCSSKYIHSVKNYSVLNSSVSAIYSELLLFVQLFPSNIVFFLQCKM